MPNLRIRKARKKQTKRTKNSSRTLKGKRKYAKSIFSKKYEGEYTNFFKKQVKTGYLLPWMRKQYLKRNKRIYTTWSNVHKRFLKSGGKYITKTGRQRKKLFKKKELKLIDGIIKRDYLPYYIKITKQMIKKQIKEAVYELWGEDKLDVDNELPIILDMLPLTENFILELRDEYMPSMYYTLNDNNRHTIINWLLENLHQYKITDSEPMSESDKELLRIMKSYKQMAIYRPTPKGTKLKSGKLQTKKADGWFPFYTKKDFKINLEKYGIFNEDDDKKIIDVEVIMPNGKIKMIKKEKLPLHYKENCLYWALKEGGLCQEKLNNLRLILKTRFVPICKLKEVAKILEIYITLTKEGIKYDTEKEKEFKETIEEIKKKLFMLYIIDAWKDENFDEWEEEKNKPKKDKDITEEIKNKKKLVNEIENKIKIVKEKRLLPENNDKLQIELMNKELKLLKESIKIIKEIELLQDTNDGIESFEIKKDFTSYYYELYEKKYKTKFNKHKKDFDKFFLKDKWYKLEIIKEYIKLKGGNLKSFEKQFKNLGKKKQKNRVETFGKPENKHFELGSINNHFFIIEKTKYTSTSIKKYHYLKDKVNFNKIINETTFKKSNKRFINSFQLIQILNTKEKNNDLEYLTPITASHNVYSSQFYDKVQDLSILKYPKTHTKYNFRLNEKFLLLLINKYSDSSKEFSEEELFEKYMNFSSEEKTKFINESLEKLREEEEKEGKKDVVYFDFETYKKPILIKKRKGNKIISETIQEHIAFCVCSWKRGDFIFDKKTGLLKPNIKTFYGKKCGRYLLDSLTNDTTLIAHNCSYDFNFIAQHFFIKNYLPQGSGFLTADGKTYKSRYVKGEKVNGESYDITLKCSYKLISMKLSAFGKCFNLDQEKEVMPYDLLTEENIKNKWVLVDDALKLLTKKDGKQFLKNCEKWDLIGENFDGKIFNLHQYTINYCKLDVEVLGKGYEKFRGWMLELSNNNLDIDKILTIASLADKFLKYRGCYDGTFSLSGIPRWFIQQCVVGGRTMTCKNEIQYYDGYDNKGIKKIVDKEHIKNKGYSIYSKYNPFEYKKKFKNLIKNNNMPLWMLKKYIKADKTLYPTYNSVTGRWVNSGGSYLKQNGELRNNKFVKDKCIKIVNGVIISSFDDMPPLEGGGMNDYDAVSLYPSAMVRLGEEIGGFLKGIPKVIPEDKLNYKWLKNNSDGYFVEINISKFGKRFNFPLVSFKTEKGIRHFTDDIKDFYIKDKEGNIKPRPIYIGRFALEDMIKYHKMIPDDDFKIIRGYYFNEGRNNTIGGVMRELFEERLKKKAEKNEIQIVYKMIMNTSYGKNLLKPIATTTNIIYGKENFDKEITFNYNFIKNITKIKGTNAYSVKKIVPIEKHFNNVHIGVEILDFSKRIMNEVMCLADDLGFKIYTTDTDSLHIKSDDIVILEKEFKKLYKRELAGKKLGEFHIDFDIHNLKKNYDGIIIGNGDKIDCKNIVAVKSIFLGKKCYIDKLIGICKKTGKKISGYHVRMKGVPTQSIYHRAHWDYNGDIMELYEDLRKGEEIEFDLLCVNIETKREQRCNFKQMKDLTIHNNLKFTRRISF